jgi:hypothetical protein
MLKETKNLDLLTQANPRNPKTKQKDKKSWKKMVLL